MGLIAQTFRPRNRESIASVPLSGGYPAMVSSGNYQNTSRAYMGNEIVSAGLNIISDAAAEPPIIGRRYRRARPQRVGTKPSVVRAEEKYQMAVRGVRNRAGAMALDAMMLRNGFWEETEEHPLVSLLNNPNPYISGGEMWALAALDYYLAGNVYIYKARYASGVLEGAVGELYRLRPDRMRPIPGDMTAGEPLVKAYEYNAGATKVTIPAQDVCHIKAKNPFDAYVGLPPILSLLPRVDIDTYQRRFLSTFYERGGAGVGAIFNVKGRMDQETKDGIRDRFKRMFGGGVLDILVTSADEATYTPLGLNRGLRDALPQEINAVTESRMAMVLRIPGVILGLLLSYDNASYASHKVALQVFWDNTMTTLLSLFSQVLTRSFVPEYGGSIDEVLFDLSSIHALQEDEDAFQERARKNVAARIWTMEEGRLKTGVGEVNPDEHFLLPDGSAVKAGELDSTAPVQEPAQPARIPAAVAALMLEAPRVGRPSLEDDTGARTIWLEASRLKGQNPAMTWAQVAARVGVVDRTLRKYRAAFEDD